MIIEKERRIYVNDHDWERAKVFAKGSGRSVSAYIRTLIRLEQPKPIPPEEFYKIYRELSAIGNNVNQMAKLANTTGKAEYVNFADDLERIYLLQKKIYELFAVPRDLKDGGI